VRILILNWRCPMHPRAGGAEFLTYEVMKRFVASGDEVEWFSASFPGAKDNEDMDGIHIVRAGRQWTVHLHAFRRYFRRLRPHFDLVIDEVNTVPFFTPLWADVPVFMLIYQLAREVWWYECPFPINALGFALEPLYLRLYRRVPVLTESNSTVVDLNRLGFSGPLTLVPVGIDDLAEGAYAKPSCPVFLYVGRLSPSKRVGDIIKAFDSFQTKLPQARLWLVGDGPTSYVRSLRGLVHQLGIEQSVDFCGSVSGTEKYQRMTAAHALLMASVREGWGLVVTEANACGTPAVVYNVPGLRDAVRHAQTGLVVDPTPEAMATGMMTLWKDRLLREQLGKQARAWSRSFSFDAATATIRAALTLTASGFAASET
jgi:glycosyltransferase involved in cell wall biosynthesis